MENDNVSSSGNEYTKYIEALSREAAIELLLELCNDGAIAERIFTMTKASLSEVDADVMNREHSFAPLINSQSHTLILGSLPGVESLREQKYYAHIRNNFWRIIYAIYGETLDEDYSLRCEFLLSKNLALWDVCGSAIRIGSADDKMVDIEANGIAELLDDYPNIRRIVLNGRKAEKEYHRYFPEIAIPAVYAPSTSPALAALTFDEKLSAWRNALCFDG